MILAKALFENVNFTFAEALALSRDHYQSPLLNEVALRTKNTHKALLFICAFLAFEIKITGTHHCNSEKGRISMIP
ncbi:hypothetical protein [Chryseobacterium nakagawai]|nr:hypothetical protein [Chryseobacterium nakagawai]